MLSGRHDQSLMARCINHHCFVWGKTPYKKLENLRRFCAFVKRQPITNSHHGGNSCEHQNSITISDSQAEHRKRLATPPSGRQSPELKASNVHYEFTERQQAISCGDIRLIHPMATKPEQAKQVNRNVLLFQLVQPNAESDHLLNIRCSLQRTLRVVILLMRLEKSPKQRVRHVL